MPQVLIYATAFCSYCTRARRLLQDKGVAFAEVPVDREPEQWQVMVERSRRHTVPQVFVDDLHLGGYDDLARLDASGELDSLLGR
jgi:glutaredoxin 3